jgi:dTDP-4-dehydrorhamnose 3,5-epimerase
MSERFTPDAYRGARWNDPAFGIDWPRQPVVVADRDANYPDYSADPDASHPDLRP